MSKMTGWEFGLSGDDQIHIVANYISSKGGVAQMRELYSAVEHEMEGHKLSQQGRASLRFFVNKIAVEKGLIVPHDRAHPGWRLTARGYELAGAALEGRKPIRATPATAQVQRASKPTTDPLAGLMQVVGNLPVSTANDPPSNEDSPLPDIKLVGTLEAVQELLAQMKEPIALSAFSLTARHADGSWVVQVDLN